MPAPSMDPTASDYSRTVFVSGKVVLDDGTELTESVAIQTICGRQRRTVADTDAHGNFTFRFGDTSSGITSAVGDAATSSIRSASGSGSSNWEDCRIQAVLAGFSSEEIELASRLETLQNTDLGRIPLHRMQRVEGTSISVTSALAPSSAKKALEKGREQEKKLKWDEAEQSFEKAVQIYPKYAVAWFELGRVRLRKNDAASAKKSFQQALEADPRYVNPYDGLAQLAMVARQWQEVIDVTGKLLALNPVNFPVDYFFNGVANYYVHNLDAAESSARHGLKIDEAHQIPKLPYLLAMVLTQKHDYAQASEYLQQYLSLEKNPAEAEKARRELSEIARSSAAISSPPGTEKK